MRPVRQGAPGFVVHLVPAPSQAGPSVGGASFASLASAATSPAPVSSGDSAGTSAGTSPPPASFCGAELEPHAATSDKATNEASLRMHDL
jgi:hypothetical protein